MTRHAPVLIASLLAVLIILLVDLAGLFNGVNQRVIDEQQRHLPRDTGPYSDRIVLVDIDDGSIDRIGRWPWPRSYVADAVNELHLAGARTVALDIEFSNPQDPTWDPETGTSRDDDAALAQAVNEATILATVLAEDELETRWNDAGGQPGTLQILITKLQSDITATPEQPPAGMVLDDSDRDAFASNQLLLKKRAIQHAVRTLPKTASLRDLEIEIVPSTRLHGVDYPERPLLDAGLNQYRGLSAAIAFLSESRPEERGSSSDRVPLERLLKRAGGMGYVNITHRGPDGAVRSIYPSQSIEGGKILSLGLAAVAHYQDIRPGDVRIDEDGILIGDVELPADEGRLWLNWPRSDVDWRWRNLHRADADDQEYTGHLSISEIIEIARARRTLEIQAAVLADLSRDLMRVLRQNPDMTSEDWLSPAIQSELEEEIAFSLDGVQQDTDLSTLADDPETLEMLKAMQQWQSLNLSISEDQARLEVASGTLSEQVDDALVFVGWTATGAAADFVQTAAGPRTPGVLVHATLADMVLQERGLARAPYWVDPLAILVIGLLVALFVTFLGPWSSTILSILTAIAYVGIGGLLLLWTANLLVPLAAPILAAVCAWATGTGVQAAMAQRDKRRITRQFRARVSDQLVDALIADPAAISMTGVSREMTIFFADLAGFTTLSENLESEQVVRILNTYLSALTSQLVEHGAYVNKFLGDGVMAFWSAFQEEPAQSHLACAAAMACHETVIKLNALHDKEHPSIGLRMGIATGPAIVGDCGAPPDLNDYTVIGDTANLASRLEGANKQFGTSVMINDRTHELLGDMPVRCRCIGNLQVVGRESVVRSWEVVGLDFPQEAIDLSAMLDEAMTGGDQRKAREILEKLGNIPGQQGFVDRWRQVIDVPAEEFGGPLRLIEK